MKKILILLILFAWAPSLACNMLGFLPTATPAPTSTSTPSLTPTQTLTPTSTPTPTITSTPTITPTPGGNRISAVDSSGFDAGFTIYVPEGYKASCFGRICIINPGRMSFVHSPYSGGSAGDVSRLDISVARLMVELEGVGMFTANEKSPPYDAFSLGDTEVRAVDFSGTSQEKPIEGQIIYVQNGNNVFWAYAWVNKSSDPDEWKNLENVFHFIFASVVFTR